MSEPLPAVGQGRRPPVPRPWPRLPRWFWVGTAVLVAAFLAVGVVAIVAVTSFKEQPLYERRSAPAQGQSHYVGRITLPDAPLRPVRCGSVDGLKVQGGPDTGPLLAGAVGGLCKRLNNLDPYGKVLAERIVGLAKQGAVVSFANFGRTGELSTTIPGPRILLSDSFLRGGGQFKGFLLPELAHELWHAGSLEPTAVDELTARQVEWKACQQVPSPTAFRGCTDAKRIVSDPAAIERLRRAGYPY